MSELSRIVEAWLVFLSPERRCGSQLSEALARRAGLEAALGKLG